MKLKTALIAMLCSTAALSQPPVPPPSARHRDNALAVAGRDLTDYAAKVCFGRTPTPAASSERLPATKVFDNLVFLGFDPLKWNAWALLTSDGIILFDTLESSAEAERYIVGGLRSLGLDPMSVKHIVVMHGHVDHWGGAAYLHRLTGAPVWMSAADWDSVVTQKPIAAQDPMLSRGRVLGDGDSLTLGDTMVRFHLTPGHSRGTLSAIVPAIDGKARHVAAYWGGTGIPAKDADAINAYLGSVSRFRRVARAAGVDVLISNHPTNDLTLARLPLLAQRKPGEDHPFVIGAQGYARTLKILEDCARAARADMQR